MNEDAARTKSLGRTAHEMKEAMARAPDVCPVCRFTAGSMKEYVDYLFYEQVTDRTMRAAIRAAGGFCRRHASLVRRQADALGTALIYKDVLTNELRAFDAGRFDTPPGTAGSFARLFEGKSRGEARPPCPLCLTERETEERGADAFLEGMGSSEVADLFSRSAGLCLPHFRLTFERCKDAAVWAQVLHMERRVLQGLVDELTELARKYDYRFRDEAVGAEASSWPRALNVTSGWPEE